MQGKSLLGELRQATRHFYATSLRGEVSDANVRGYLRAASQIEEIWQQIDEKLAGLIAQGTAPWEAYAQLRYPLAFIRNAINAATSPAPAEIHEFHWNFHRGHLESSPRFRRTPGWQECEE